MPRKSQTLIPTEAQEAKALVEWWSYACRKSKIPENALIHIPNEGKRSIRAAQALKSQGMRPGVPDYFLAVPRLDCPGLWIELKRRKNGVVSDEQRIMIAMLKAQGYEAVIAYGAEQAANAIRAYLIRPKR